MKKYKVKIEFSHLEEYPPFSGEMSEVPGPSMSATFFYQSDLFKWATEIMKAFHRNALAKEFKEKEEENEKST
jgi:hypothetical protein